MAVITRTIMPIRETRSRSEWHWPSNVELHSCCNHAAVFGSLWLSGACSMIGLVDGLHQAKAAIGGMFRLSNQPLTVRL